MITFFISAILISMPRLFIGTSGWHYSHWANGVFYPEGLSQNKWLQYYIKFFNSVELNVSFYRLPAKKTFENWNKRTPKNFYFIAKGSRFITHIKRLKDCKEYLALFFANLIGLKDKLACVLWQLPPGLKKDKVRLESFLKLLKDKRSLKTKHAFEFRHVTWFDNQIYDLLKEYNFCLCIADSDFWPCVKELTANFIYLRFHGRGGLYSGNYSNKELEEWAYFAKGTKRDIFTFFNNDAYGYAVKNALRFRELLE